MELLRRNDCLGRARISQSNPSGASLELVQDGDAIQSILS